MCVCVYVCVCMSVCVWVSVVYLSKLFAETYYTMYTLTHLECICRYDIVALLVECCDLFCMSPLTRIARFHFISQCVASAGCVFFPFRLKNLGVHAVDDVQLVWCVRNVCVAAVMLLAWISRSLKRDNKITICLPVVHLLVVLVFLIHSWHLQALSPSASQPILQSHAPEQPHSRPA